MDSIYTYAYATTYLLRTYVQCDLYTRIYIYTINAHTCQTGAALDNNTVSAFETYWF